MKKFCEKCGAEKVERKYPTGFFDIDTGKPAMASEMVCPIGGCDHDRFGHKFDKIKDGLFSDLGRCSKCGNTQRINL